MLCVLCVCVCVRVCVLCVCVCVCGSVLTRQGTVDVNGVSTQGMARFRMPTLIEAAICKNAAIDQRVDRGNVTGCGCQLQRVAGLKHHARHRQQPPSRCAESVLNGGHNRLLSHSRQHAGACFSARKGAGGETG